MLEAKAPEYPYKVQRFRSCDKLDSQFSGKRSKSSSIQDGQSLNKGCTQKSFRNSRDKASAVVEVLIRHWTADRLSLYRKAGERLQGIFQGVWPRAAARKETAAVLFCWGKGQYACKQNCDWMQVKGRNRFGQLMTGCIYHTSLYCQRQRSWISSH